MLSGGAYNSSFGSIYSGTQRDVTHRCAVQSNQDGSDVTHDVEEEERFGEVGVLLGVLDDLRLLHVTSDLEVDAR